MAYQKLKQRIGVPVGYRHRWSYSRGPWRETKFKRNKWKFLWRSTKSRKGSSRGGPPVGYKVLWTIKALQSAKKVSPRKYKTVMFGTKKLAGYYDPRRKKWKRAN